MSDTTAASDDGSYANKPPAQQFAYKQPPPQSNSNMMTPDQFNAKLKARMDKQVADYKRKRAARNANA